MLRYANLKQYTRAIADFQAALKVEPSHANAIKYLSKTKSVHERIESERESARRGEFLLASEHDSAVANPVKSIHAAEFRSFVDQLLNEDPDPSSKRHKKSKKKHKKKEKKKRKRQDQDASGSSSE